MESWYIWIIAGIILLIIEIFTPAFLAASLAIGCILAGIISATGASLDWQLISFSAGTLFGFFGVRPIMTKYAYRQNTIHATNVAALIGKKGRVTVDFDNVQKRGRVMVEGDDWMAESEGEDILKTGCQVEIVRIESTLLIVKPV
jgi:membrane protein implicated in regulation of membrane protease activity